VVTIEKIDFDKEEEEFKKELDEGKFKIERIPNDAQSDYEEVVERDLAAFSDYLRSDFFKPLSAGLHK